MSLWLVFRSRKWPVSFQFKKRLPIVLAILSLVTLVVAILCIAVGEYAISPVDIWYTLIGAGSAKQEFIIMTLRMPRIIVAFLVGAGLAASGTILQGITRNYLASPGIIGLNAGASLAAVAAIVLFPALGQAFLPMAAFVGAFLTAVIIYLLAWQQGSSPIRMILVGLGVTSIASALVTLVLTFGQIRLVNQAAIWMIGSMYGRDWEHVWPLVVTQAIFLPLSLLFARHLNLLQMGNDVAKGLGGRIETEGGLLLLFSIALASSAVAAAGPLNFVGLMAPHIARRLVGNTHGGLLLTAAFCGGLIVLLADLLGRVLFAPIEIPCGIITAVIGAPYFLYLLYGERSRVK